MPDPGVRRKSTRKPARQNAAAYRAVKKKPASRTPKKRSAPRSVKVNKPGPKSAAAKTARAKELKRRRSFDQYHPRPINRTGSRGGPSQAQGNAPVVQKRRPSTSYNVPGNKLNYPRPKKKPPTYKYTKGGKKALTKAGNARRRQR